jgi:bifunctional non-homologous end joining protein LigD
VGTGFTEESLRTIHGKLTALERREPPVANPPTGAAAKGVHWVEPQLVAEVAFAEWTGDDSLRHPSFIGLREDKPAEEVSREAPVEPPPLPEPPAKVGGSTVAGVALTNPDRVLWPELSLTKLELARYYESIEELMLPHMADRPLSLVRCPSGYTAGCFYHKHIENFPKSVATVGIYEPGDDKTVPYARIRNLSSVIGLVQMGVLEIHPWGSRADAPDKPDRLIFDLDPDPDLPWSTVTATALLLRSELGRLGLHSWVKTTGGKGIHVVVPIRRTLTWDDARAFAKSFVESIVALEPRLLTSNMSKAKRGGRIFIDYLRNARGATAIAAYSSRARPEAPVSVPLYWEELEDAKERPTYNVHNLGDRVRTLPGDPWSDIASSRQSITSQARAKLGIR